MNKGSKELTLYRVEFRTSTGYEDIGFNRKSEAFEFAKGKCREAKSASDVIIRIAERGHFIEAEILEILSGKKFSELRIYRTMAMCPPKRDWDVVTYKYENIEAIGMPDIKVRIKAYFREIDVIEKLYYKKEITKDRAYELSDKAFEKYFKVEIV